ncbi:MAG: carboxylating nicotinate-nucleotide diphosphorylase, partial [Candidatus Hodarchaeales archaeon]
MAYLPPKIIEQKLLQFLNEDVVYGDITSELVPDTLVVAELTSKQKGIVCGVSFAKILLESLGVEVLISSKDGDTIEKGSIILRLKGSSRAILISERVVLNLLMRLSGIATQTMKLVKKTKRVRKNIVIASTRKTTPGFRYFEKYAVKIGGGDPHRWNLSDTILIKENHLKLLDEDPIPQIFNQSGKISSFTKKIDIEVENISELKNALKFSPEIIML